MFNNIVSTLITRDNIKSAISLTVSIKATQAAEDALITNTDLDEDSLRIRLAAAAAGGVVTGASRPATDAMVDKIADKIQSVRAKRADKKNQDPQK